MPTVVERKGRKVFDFFLKPIQERTVLPDAELSFNRLIPTEVKVAVWKRDHGKCVSCGRRENLHYDPQPALFARTPRSCARVGLLLCRRLPRDSRSGGLG
jgi:hypothetical protein